MPDTLEFQESIEVSYDIGSMAAEIGLVMDPERHQILPDCDWILWARRAFKKPDLFLYHHREAGTYVLAEWLQRPETGAPLCVELEVFDENPEMRPSQPNATGEYLRLRLCTTSEMKRRMRQSMREAHDARVAERTAASEGKREALRHMKRHGMETSARAIELGMMPGDYAGFGEKCDLTADMAETAKQRVYSYEGKSSCN